MQKAISDRAVPTVSDIKSFQEYAAILPQVEYPVFHHHSDHIYLREFKMPAGHYVVGKEHRTRHLNILASGKCTVWTVHGRYDLDASKGPVTFESMAGVKKIVLAYTDIVWMTVHSTDERDLDKLENEMICPEEQMSLFPELDSEALLRVPVCQLKSRDLSTSTSLESIAVDPGKGL